MGGQRKKRPKISKKYRKIALFSLFQGEGGATEKRPKNSTFKPLSTMLVPCLKIQGRATAPSAPRCRRPWWLSQKGTWKRGMIHNAQCMHTYP